MDRAEIAALFDEAQDVVPVSPVGRLGLPFGEKAAIAVGCAGALPPRRRGSPRHAASLMSRVAAFVAKHPGADLNAIAKAFAARTSKDRHVLARRLKQLVVDQRLRREGSFMHWRYYPTDRQDEPNEPRYLHGCRIVTLVLSDEAARSLRSLASSHECTRSDVVEQLVLASAGAGGER